MPRRRSLASLLFGELLSMSLNGKFNQPTHQQQTALWLATQKPVRKPNDLSPSDLEELAACVYHRLGYRNVTHSGQHASTDGGVDVWMLNQQGYVEIVQCKQLQEPVHRTALIEFANVMRKQHAVQGHYWAPSGFTGPAFDYARQHNISMFDAKQIQLMVDKAFQNQVRQHYQQHGPPPPKRYLGLTCGQIVILSLISTIMLGLLCLLSFAALLSALPS